ncbi:MAG: T9SS type A sorting domain-containing protein [Bacteroidia bacterium]
MSTALLQSKAKFSGIILSLFICLGIKATNLYWVGGTSTWGTSANWSLTSGGAGGAGIPTAADNVFFDVNSFNGAGQSVTINSTGTCKNMDWTGVTNNPNMVINSSITIYGSLILDPGMVTSGGAAIYFSSTSAGNAITSAGHTFPNDVYFNGVSGSWTLNDNFSVATPNAISVSNGTLNTNNKNITTGTFICNSGNARTLNLGSSSITINGSGFDASGANLNLNAGTSTVNFTSASATLTGGSQAFNDINFSFISGNQFLNGGVYYNKVIFAGASAINSPSAIVFSSVDFQAATTINNGNCTFGKATFSDNATIAGNNVFDTLIFSAGKTYTLYTAASIQTINLKAQMIGNCSQPIILKTSASGTTAGFNSTSAVINADYLKMQDITAGGGASFVANNTIDMGNNSGWTINALPTIDYYWIGGSGNWNDLSHWSTSSGGTAATCMPTRADNVHFDGNSFSAGSKIVTLNVSAECNSMDWTGATNSPILSGTADLNIFGSLTFISAMTNSWSGKLYFKSAGTGNTITSAGKSFTNEVHLNGANGDWTLQDALSITGTSGNLYLENGYLVTNDKALTCYYFETGGSNLRGLYLGASVITVTGWVAPYYAWNASGTNLTIDAGTSLIKLTMANSVYFGGGNGNIYYDILFQDVTNTGTLNDCSGFHNIVFNGPASFYPNNSSGSSLLFNKDVTFYGGATNNLISKATFLGNGYLQAGNTFDTLIFSGGKTYTLCVNGVLATTVNNVFQANGTCSSPISIISGSAGTQATLTCSMPSVVVNYVLLTDIKALGGAVFTANNSFNMGNNTGWTINLPASQNLYWRGGAGNWDDVNHWSFTSGGAGGACVPTLVDNVFFNASSFSAGSKIVTINVNASCKNMSWTGATFTPTLAGTANLNIYGSLTLISGMNRTFTGLLNFKSTTSGNTITSAGKTFASDVHFDGAGGGWVLQDAFNTSTGDVYLVKGTLNTNNKNLSCANFNSSNTNIRQLNLGSSTVTLSGISWVTSSSGNLTLNSGTSLIKFISSAINLNFDGGTGVPYYNLTFQDPASDVTFNSGNIFHNLTCYGHCYLYSGGSYNKMDFRNGAWLNGTITADSVLFSVGTLNKFMNNANLTINKYFMADGTAGNLTKLYNYAGAQIYYINKSSCTVCCNYLDIQYCQAGGGASWYADNSTNGGGNSGWSFAACPAVTLGVGPISGPAATCMNATGNVYSIPAISGGTYVWTVPSGATITSGQGTPSITVTVGSINGNIGVTAAACGNTNSATKAITVNPIPAITNISVTPATCNHSDGNATATVSGGTSPYIYQWSSGDTLAFADSLSSGQYLLQVYDNIGCKATATTNVNSSDGPAVTVLGTTAPTCNGGSNGALSVSVSGGVPPYHALWSNGSTSLSLSGLVAGPYDLTITDTNDCVVNTTVTITQPAAITTVFSTNPSACAGATGDASASPSGGTGTYTYQWDANAGNQVTQIAGNLAAGIYSVTVTDANFCSYTAVAVVNNVASTLSSNISNIVAGDCSITSAGSLTINASGGAGSYSYLWSNGNTNPVVIGLQPGTYYCTVTDASLCSDIQTAVVPSAIGNIQQNLCMVTVDTGTFTNLVIWEKTTTNDIKSFKIYRESSTQNVYTAIATVPYANLSQFTDSVANPAVHSWRYKITAIDSCNNETPYSLSHKTIHLSQNLGVGGEINLAWDYYDGFAYTTYYIWRHDPSTNWVKLDSLSANYTTYTDFTPPSVNSRYMIEVLPPGACNTTFRLPGGNDVMTSVTKSRSNIKNNRVMGIKRTDGLSANLLVYPNPASSVITVIADKKVEKGILSIENLLGQQVLLQEWNKSPARQIIDVSQLNKGIYLLRLNNDKINAVKKIIVE